jgi:hypothetical protein
MTKCGVKAAPVIAVLVNVALFWALGAAAYGQDLFQQRNDAPLTAEQKAAGEKEPIFCPTMKVGQMCTHGTAAILGLTGADADEWTAWARKYNKSVNEATEQLFEDASGKLDAKQMELLKAWFAIGWNPQINSILYGKDLDNLENAQTDSVKAMQKK